MLHSENSAFCWLTLDLVAVREPHAVLLTAGTCWTGLKAGSVLLSFLDHLNQFRLFHFTGFQPHLLSNTLNLFYSHLRISLVCYLLKCKNMHPKLKYKSAGPYFCDDLLSMFFGYGLEIKKDHSFGYQQQRPLPSHREGPFSMCTDTVTIYRVSIPCSRIWSFTVSMGTSSLWKIPVARAASTSVSSKTSEKCSTFPAPDEAITGMVTASLTCLISSMSKPLLVPSLSMQFKSISPAPSFSQVCTSCLASMSRPSLPPLTVHWYQQILERKKENWFFLISYLVFLSVFYTSPNHVPTVEGKLRKFYPI